MAEEERHPPELSADELVLRAIREYQESLERAMLLPADLMRPMASAVSGLFNPIRVKTPERFKQCGFTAQDRRFLKLLRISPE